MVARLLACCLVALMLWPMLAGADELIVTSDHSMIGRDKTLQLSVRLTGGDGNFDIDLSPLHKNFYVIPNGSGHQSGEWMEKRFQLGPKRAGMLQVPALTATRDGRQFTSQPFTIGVSATPGDVDDARLWIETKVDRNTAWQRQQLVYSFSVFSTNDMVTPRLSLPDFSGFNVEPVQENVHEDRVMKGIKVHVIHYKYLLFPQQAGDLAIGGPTMRATLLQTEMKIKDHAGQASFGDQRRILRPKIAHGQIQHIKVQLLPAAAQTLPVGKLSIQSGLSGNSGFAGEPLTWTVTLHGLGMSAVSLPDIRQQMQVDSSFKTYPEAPDIALKKVHDQAVATGIWRVVVLPQQAGEMSLPAVSLSYFNPASGRIENVASKPISVHIAAARQTQDNQVFRANPSRSVKEMPTLGGYSAWWRWLALALFLLWLATLALWLKPMRYIRTLLGRQQGKRLNLRWVLSAHDALDQFARIKRFLGVPASLSPLGLLYLLPGLQDSEAGAWLARIEKSRYAKGNLPAPLNAAALKSIQGAAEDGLFATAGGGTIAPEEFGRIGSGRRGAAASAE